MRSRILRTPLQAVISYTPSIRLDSTHAHAAKALTRQTEKEGYGKWQTVFLCHLFDLSKAFDLRGVRGDLLNGDRLHQPASHSLTHSTKSTLIVRPASAIATFCVHRCCCAVEPSLATKIYCTCCPHSTKTSVEKFETFIYSGGSGDVAILAALVALFISVAVISTSR